MTNSKTSPAAAITTTMGANVPVSDLERLVLIMYGMAPPSAGGPTQQQALHWLLSFSEAPSSWPSFLELLHSSHDAVQYFAANCVYAMVCRGWTTYAEGTRASMYADLWAKVTADGSRLCTLAARRLALALAAAAVLWKQPGVVAAFVRKCVLETASLSHPLPVSHLALLYLDMLSGIADEADDRPISRTRATDVQAQLVACSGVVMGLCEALLHRHFAGARSAAAADAATMQGAISALLVAQKWVAYGLTAGDVASRFPGLLDFALTVLTETPHAGLAAAAASFLEATLCANCEGPREPNRDAAVETMTTRLVRGMPYVRAAMAAQQWDIVRAIAVTTAAVGVAEDRWLVERFATAAPSFAVDLSLFPAVVAAAAAGGVTLGALAIEGAPVGIGVLFGELLLLLCSSADRRVAQICLDVFMSIQSLPRLDRHPFYRAPIFKALLRTITIQCSWDSGSDRDAIRDYRSRNSAALDALFDCFAALRGAFIDTLLTCVRTPPGECSVAAAAAAPAVFPGVAGAGGEDRAYWMSVEAVVFVLRTQQQELTDLLSEAADSPTSVGSDVDVEEAIVSLVLLCAGRIGEGLRALPSTQAGAANGSSSGSSSAAGLAAACPELIPSVCRWFGGLHHWMAGMQPSRTLRYATGPPFERKRGGGAADGVDASFGTVRAGDLLQSVLRFLADCVQWHSGGAAYELDRSSPSRGLHAAAHVAGIEFDRGASGHRGGGGASEDDDEGEQFADDDALDSTGSADAAAGALLRICRSCGTTIASPASIISLNTALSVAYARGLTTSSTSDSVAALLALVAALPRTTTTAPSSTAASASPATTRDQCLRFVMEPIVVGLSTACAALDSTAITTPTTASQASVTATAVAKHCALLIAALRSPAMEAADSDDAALLRSANNTITSPVFEPAAFLVDATWPWLERALIALHGSSEHVSLVLATLRALIRVCPIASHPRLSSLLTACVHLFSMHHYADALSAIGTAISDLVARDGSGSSGAAALPNGSQALQQQPSTSPTSPHGGSPPPLTLSSSSSRPAAIQRTVQARGAAPVVLHFHDSDDDDSPIVVGETVLPRRQSLVLSPGLVAAIEQLMSTLCAEMRATLGTLPTASTGGGILVSPLQAVFREFNRLCLSILGLCPSAGDSALLADTAVAVVSLSFDTRDRDTARAAADLLRALLSPPTSEQQQPTAATQGAMEARGRGLVLSLWKCLVDEVGVKLTAQPLLDAFLALFTAYHDRGIAELMEAGLDAVSPPLAPESAAGLDSGLECLSGPDRHAIAVLARDLAHSHVHKFRMLLTDVGRIARRQETREALLSYGLSSA